MVPGLNSFREWFKDYKDQYVLIGGAACDIYMESADLPFNPLLNHTPKMLLTYVIWRIWPLTLAIHIYTFSFVFITIPHENTLLTSLSSKEGTSHAKKPLFPLFCNLATYDFMQNPWITTYDFMQNLGKTTYDFV